MEPSEQRLLPPDRNDVRSSVEISDDDFGSDIDATEFLRPKRLSSNRSNHTVSHYHRFSRPRRWCVNRRWVRSRSCVTACVILAFLLGILLIGIGYVFKKAVEEPPYGQSPPWYPTPRGGIASSWMLSYEKASDLVRRMTLAEKVNVTTGVGWMMGLAVGSNGPAVHVGFPQLNFQDGPLGIRFADNASALPAGITVGATWDKELMYLRGKVHAEEARRKGINGLLGPCVGPLGRMPAGGRNWEGFGADPYLQGVAGAQTILGIQSEGVMATVKHFVANEQEHFRQPWEWGLPHALSANIDDRTLHEIYAWPFGDAVKAGVASVMCSYNMVNNSYACGNSKLINGILKDEMGFQGFVMSDWLAQRSGVSTALAGLDMTMPGDGLSWQNGESLWGSELTRSVLNGSVPIERLNDMATRIVAAWFQLGQDKVALFDRKGPNFSSWTNEKMDVSSPGSRTPQPLVEVNRFVDVQGNHSSVAHRVAADGIVMLKNTNNCLPLGVDGTTGSRTRPSHSKIKIGIFGEDAGPGQGPNHCKDRGCNEGTLGSGWGSGAVEFPYLIPPRDSLTARFDKSAVVLSEHLTNRPPKTTYKDLDVCIVFANADSGEGFLAWGGVGGDRNDLFLQKGGDELIYSVATGCGGGTGEVVVVIHAVGPVLMERWIDLPNVKAVLHANLPGQESGAALADVLFGTINPSGKLPYTIGRTPDDYGVGAKVMYTPNGVIPQQNFSEGLFIDYRYFDKFQISPRFEFGFGLSYTSFEVGNLRTHELRQKSALPAARPVPAASPPDYNTSVPSEDEARFPPGFRRLEKYIYPYLERTEKIVSHPYPYPDGYDIAQPLSGAGGDEGGNPDLWETYVTVTVDVINAGPRPGKAVVQLYVAYPNDTSVRNSTEFPVKVLRGFEKVWLDKLEARPISFNLTRRDLSYWDVERQNWVMVTGGEYGFLVGQSSRDLPLQGTW